MARLTYAARKKLPASAFVFPHGTKAYPGRREFPLTNMAHARQALARAAQKKTYHPEPQWILTAYDVEKGAVRGFAMKDIRAWEPLL